MRQIIHPLADPHHNLLRFVQGRPKLRLPTAPAPPVTIPPMHVLLERTGAHTNAVRITYPDGQSENLPCNKLIRTALALRGIPSAKIDRALDYIWNFGRTLVLCDQEPSPPELRIDSITN